MYTYSQSTGHLSSTTGQIVGTGYSGNGDAMNNPKMQNVQMHGPIPQGYYSIGKAETHGKLGPLAMALIPFPSNNMFGRSGFFMHGDNPALDHTASDGCIIMNKVTRTFVADGFDKMLHVIE